MSSARLRSLHAPRRTFEPAREAPQYLAHAYQRLLPQPRRQLPAAGTTPAAPTPVARATAGQGPASLRSFVCWFRSDDRILFRDSRCNLIFNVYFR